jgi:predicted Ser/Thr protein kinase
MAQREFANQERAYNKVPDLIPQPIRLVPVQISGRWYPGIVMEMVKGKRLSDYLQDRSQRNLYIRKVRYAMRKYGIELDDLHDENILITRGGYPKLIDFMHVSIKKRTTSCRSQLRLQA